jgi:hypothetical protein
MQEGKIAQLRWTENEVIVVMASHNLPFVMLQQEENMERTTI